VTPATAIDRPAILARGLTKRFGRVRALLPVDLEVAPGERVALFGHNGAGKTTLIRLLATVTRPSAGDLWIDGVDAAGAPAEARRRLGLVSHLTYLYPDLNAVENLRFYGRMYGVPDLETRIESSLRRVGLAGNRRQPVRTFSRGMQQRLAIARATLHAPAVLLLDEPDSGLDAEAAGRLPDLLDLGAGGPAVVLATHNHALGRTMCSRVVYLDHGRVAGGPSPAGAAA
jgi:heme exporter protein A